METAWQLYLVELQSLKENGDLFDPTRIRLLRKLSTMYAYKPYRIRLETHYENVKDPASAKAHVMALVWQWSLTVRQQPDKRNHMTHWMKLWVDALFRYEELGLIRFTELWPDIRSEWLIPNGLFVRWNKGWGHLLESMYSHIKNISFTQISTNILFNFKRLLRAWTWNWSVIHPLTWISPTAMQHRLVSQNQRNTSMLVTRSNAIWNPHMIPFDADQFSYIALPLLHLNRAYVTQQIMIGIQLAKLAIQLQKINRKHISELYLISQAKRVVHTFKQKNQYYLYNSCYSDVYKNQLRNAEHALETSYQQMHTVYQSIQSCFESEDWNDLLRRFLRIARSTHWIPDVIFQNIGFTLIPNRRIQLHSIPKKVHKKLYREAIRFANAFLGQTWGNIIHQASLLLFLTHSEIMTQETVRLYDTYWLNDERYIRETHPIFNTTQTYATNYRISFHLMKSRQPLPRSAIATFCHLLVYQLNTLKQYLLRFNTNYEYTNHRTTHINLNRSLGLNTSNHTIDCNRMMDSVIRLINSEKVLESITLQEYFYQVIEWLSRQSYIPLLSAISLEEAIRTFWKELQGLDETEQIADIQKPWSPFPQLLRNPAWVIPLSTSELDDAILRIWGIQNLSSQQSSEDVDIITQLPIENPVRLPSGHVVDESTYTILRQTTGKDPFNFSPLT